MSTDKKKFNSRAFASIKTYSCFLFLLFICSSTMAQEHYRFSSLNDLFRYAEENSVTFKNASHNVLMAKYQTLEAKMSMFNPRADAVFSTTDNLKQAVNYIPAFGD